MSGFDEWFKNVELLTSEPHTEEEMRTIVWFGRLVWSAALSPKHEEITEYLNKIDQLARSTWSNMSPESSARLRTQIIDCVLRIRELK